MSNVTLHMFTTRVTKSRRISFDDVSELRRDILPYGISSREEAELFFALDRKVSRADSSFADWLVAALVDFVVWGDRPTGYVDADTARWLIPLLLNATTSVVRRFIHEIAHEAQGVDELLLSLLASRDEPAPLAA